MKYYLFIIVVFLCLSCRKKNIEEPSNTSSDKICSCKPPLFIYKNLVQSYVVPNNFDLYIPKYVDFIILNFGYEKAFTYTSNPLDSFNIYASMYKDTSYNSSYILNSVIVDTLENLSIITKYDLNAMKLKGDTVNDLFAIEYNTPYDYIQSGYKSVFPYKSDSSTLNEFNKKKGLMLVAGFTLHPAKLDPIPPKQQYEVVIKFTNGKIFRNSTPVIEN